MGARNPHQLSLDDVFTDDRGEYKWNRDLLGEAHRHCMTQFNRAIRKKAPVIVVDDANFKFKDYHEFREIARPASYNVEVVEVVPPQFTWRVFQHDEEMQAIPVSWAVQEDVNANDM